MVLLAGLLLASDHRGPVSAWETRSFHLGFTPFPGRDEVPDRDLAYAHIRDHADIVAHTFQNGIPWPEALHSSDVWTYPPAVVNEWYMTLIRDMTFVPSHARYLSLQPINYLYDGLAAYWGDVPQQTLPAPWNAYRFNHPDVLRAYLNYAIAAVEFFQPEYLAIGIESNILLAKRPDLWRDYKELNTYVYTALKQRYPSLRIFVPIQHEHLLGLQGASAYLRELVKDFYPDVLVREAEDLLRSSDVMPLSTYPHMAAGNVISEDYFDAAFGIADRLGLPLAVEQSGYTTIDVPIGNAMLRGSEAVQQTWIGFLLQRAFAQRFLFVINFLTVDYAENFGTAPTSLAWAYTGLWRPDGTPKPAVEVWDAFRALPRGAPPAVSPRAR